MNSFMYRVSYWLGMAHWDSEQVPAEVQNAFRDGTIPAGPGLDLGCGTGTNTIYIAKQGRQAIGIDFVPQAITKARAKSLRAGLTSQTQFITADVTRLKELKLPRCAFALDMGCFHGLSQDGQQKYAQGLADILIPGGRFMLYVLEPHQETGISFGVTPERVRAVFDPWFDLERTEPGNIWSRKSTWFWMARKSN